MTGRDDALEPEAGRDEDGDPAVAFDALRRVVESVQGDLTREMANIRKGVELALDRFEDIGPAADYRPELARLVQQLGVVGERLASVEKLPVLRQGAEHYARVLERSGTDLVSTATRKLEVSTSEFDRTARVLAAQLASARERRRQNGVVVSVGAVGIVLGVLLTLFVPRVLPGAVDVGVASTVMGRSPWKAGMALMAYDSLEGWNRIATANQLVEANKDAVMACREAAAKAGNEQKCAITVGAADK